MRTSASVRRALHSVLTHGQPASPPDSIGSIYDQAGDAYLAYADGDPERLFAFEGPHAYADRCVWGVLEANLVLRLARGATSIRILDAGCGPGTWLRRLVVRAYALGFTRIVARGFDVARGQICRARILAERLARLPGVSLDFSVADLVDPIPEADASVDLTLCLYSVLSHLPLRSLARTSSELARVTAGHLVVTVRPVGSTPTVFVDSIERARWFMRDHVEDRCDIELDDGRRIVARFHLFEAAELRAQFAEHFYIEDLRGLDLFHSRFAPDRRWNPANLGMDGRLCDELVRLEQTFARSPSFMERASHLLMVAHRRGDRV